jgi:hypothetical protein
MVPRNKVSPRIARPRLRRPQHGRASFEGVNEYIQKTRPVTASIATTSSGFWMVYMTPSTTRGVDS